jgi:actin-binding protein IPP
MNKNFATYVNDEKYSDFTLIVKEKEFKVHRIVLAAHSPFFAKMFKVDMKEAANMRGELKDTEPDTFEELLGFIYTGSVTQAADRLAMELFIAANLMQVVDLKEICVEKIIENMSKDNAVDVYELAERFDVEGPMKTKAWEIIES